MSAEEVDAIPQAIALQEQLSGFLQPPPASVAEQPSETIQTELEVSEFPQSESPVEDGESADPPPEKSSPDVERRRNTNPIRSLTRIIPSFEPPATSSRVRHLLEQSRKHHRDKHKAIPIRNGGAATKAGKRRNPAERRAKHPQSAPPPANRN